MVSSSPFRPGLAMVAPRARRMNAKGELRLILQRNALHGRMAVNPGPAARRDSAALFRKGGSGTPSRGHEVNGERSSESRSWEISDAREGQRPWLARVKPCQDWPDQIPGTPRFQEEVRHDGTTGASPRCVRSDVVSLPRTLCHVGVPHRGRSGRSRREELVACCGMPSPDLGRLPVWPNLTDYDSAYRDFSWESARSC
jgi:hypothetical protein